MSVTNMIKSVQDIMRKDSGVDGDAQRIAQLVWMLFLKIVDDKDAELELMKEDYESPIPENIRWSEWAKEKEDGTPTITGDELLDFVNNTLFPKLKELPYTPADNPRGFMIKEIFQDSFNYMKSGTLLRQVINEIESIDFNSSKDRHLFNDIYETFLKDLQSAGNAGEFYTPRAVTQFMVDMTSPQVGEIVLDPACGTGGFLACATEHIKKQNLTTDDLQQLETNIRGIEKKSLPHTLAMTNLILRGIEIPAIRRDNSLSRPLIDIGKKDQVDVIVTNPPFGGIEEDGIQANFPPQFRTKETADLFLILIMQLLKENGRGAIVLPDGILFGEGVKTRIKEKLLEEFNLHTIVRLPNGVFSPYTGIKTNLLFFEKGTPTQEIWYYEHPYPAGMKSYSKTKPIRIEEFEQEKQWWNQREENEYAWKVTIDEIKAKDYNLDFKNPFSKEETLLSPEEALAIYEQSVQQVQETKRILKQELEKILEGMK